MDRSRVHDVLRLYINRESYMIEPSYLDPSVMSENLLINRESAIIRRNVPALPTAAQETVMYIYGIFGIIRLYSGEYLIVITNRERVGVLDGAEIWRMTGVRLLPFARSLSQLTEQQANKEEEHLTAINAVLNGDNYYFSYSHDLTRFTQARFANPAADGTPLWRQADERFYFNRHLQRRFMEITAKDGDQDLSAFILPVVSGFMEIRQAQIGSNSSGCFTFALLSRRACDRLGTRYFSRGIDLQGNVSNFVETEQLVAFPVVSVSPTGNNDGAAEKQKSPLIYSHVQVRGSIPLFWRQIVNARYKPRLELVDSPQTQEMVKTHIETLKSVYGDLLLFNLVDKKGGELTVASAMTKFIGQLNDSHVKYTHFDFHHECRKLQWHRVLNLLHQFDGDLRAQGFATVRNGVLERKQSSVVRTNCMDCLDRTNVVQSEIGRMVLNALLKECNVLKGQQTFSEFPEFDFIFKNMWADNADALSKHYSGTGALKTDFTRTGKRSINGAIQDGINSLIRYAKNNYLDGTRQDAFDLLQGRYEISPAKPVVTIVRSTRFYALTGILVFSVMALVITLAFNVGEDAKFLYSVFWLAVGTLAIQLILQHGEEFVTLPTLINPYASQSGKFFQIDLPESVKRK